MNTAQRLHDECARREDRITRQHILDAINHLESSLTGSDPVEQLELALESVQTAHARLTDPAAQGSTFDPS